MSVARMCWPVVMVLGATAPLPGQTPFPEDRPVTIEPKKGLTRHDRDRREALLWHARGLLLERDRHILEALRAFEKAAVLDPQAAANHRALVPLYHALERSEDSLRACRRVVELDPDDHETWYVLSRQLRLLGRTPEALSALERAAACRSLKENPVLGLQVHADLGTLYEDAQQFDKAVIACKEVTRLLTKARRLLITGTVDPQQAAHEEFEAYERLGRVALLAGQHDLALSAFKKAQQKMPDRKNRIAFDLARVHLAKDDLPEALTCLEQYLSTQPAGTEAYKEWIRVLRQLGNSDRVLPGLEQYAERDPLNVAVKLLLAQEYANQAQHEKAEAIYRTLMRTSPTPEVFRGWCRLGKQTPGASRGEKVLDILDEEIIGSAKSIGDIGIQSAAGQAHALLLVLRDDAELIKEMLEVANERLQGNRPLKPEARFVLAMLATYSKDLEQAEKHFRSCLDHPATLRRNEIEIFNGLLKVLWQRRKYEAVVEVCRDGLEKARAINPVLFHFDMARALILLGKPREALAASRKAVELADEGNRLLCRRMHALILADAGRTEEAVAECQALLHTYPAASDQRDIRYALSSVYTTAKMQPQAEKQLQLILEAHPDDAPANNDLGYLWADQGKNLAEAEKMIRKAIELDRAHRQKDPHTCADANKDNAAYADSLGWVLFRRGKVAAARHELERAAALPGGDDDPVVWDHLGDVYFRLGETERSLKAWAKAVELYQSCRRRSADEKLQEIKKKITMLESQTQHR